MKGELEKLRSLRGRKRLEYILDYYRLPLAALCALLLITFSIISRMGRSEPTLYGAFVNVSLSEDLSHRLTDGILQDLDLGLDQNPVEERSTSGQSFYLYRGLYLRQDAQSEEHAYTYASKMKILAALNAERLDLIFMDQEAFDAFSQNGYLLDLGGFLEENAPDLQALAPYLVSNTRILEDNSVELLLGNETDYRAVTKVYQQGIHLSDFPSFRESGLSGDLYLGIAANSPRLSHVCAYLKALSRQQAS